MGRVKYIIVGEKELFIENLLRHLIRKGIGYVQIENEFHFLDNIIRVLDPVDDRYLIMNDFIEENPILVGNDYIKSLLDTDEKDYFDLFDDLEPIKEEKVYQKSNFKFNNRLNNRIVNEKIKNNRNISQNINLNRRENI